MKKIFVLLMSILLVATAFAQTQTRYDTGSVLIISLVSQVPDPVQPGDYADVRWKVINTGTSAVKDVTVEFLPSYPFSLDPGEEVAREIVSLSPLQTGDSGVMLKYKVRIDTKAVEGSETIKLRYRVGSGDWTTLEYLINVQTVEANVAITDVETVPAVVSPGEPFTISLKVKNMADSAVRDVSLNLNLVIASSATSTNTAEALDILPFAPTKSVTEKRIQTLGPGEESVFTYSMIAYPDAKSKVYKIPLQLSFTDSIGTQQTRTDIVGILVDAEPDVRAVLEESTITTRGQTGTVTVKFINKGLTDIKFLDVKLQPNDLILPLSAEEVYIGNVDSDDYQTADFDVFVRNGGTEDVSIPIHYEFMDAANHLHGYDAKLSLNLDVKRESAQYQKSGGSSTLVWVVVIVLIVIAGIVILRLRKRKK